MKKKETGKKIQQMIVSAKSVCNFLEIDYPKIVNKAKKILCILRSLITEYIKKYSDRIKKLLMENFNFKRNYKLAGFSVNI